MIGGGAVAHSVALSQKAATLSLAEKRKGGKGKGKRVGEGMIIEGRKGKGRGEEGTGGMVREGRGRAGCQPTVSEH